ncbi:MAG: hypothetical protein WDZ54_07945 [Sneathiella sp.]
MTSKPFDLDKIREDPADHYETPHDVMNDRNLTPENQSEILKAWEDDIRALLRAEQENMPPADKPNSTAELLSNISKLRSQLEARQPES